MTAEQVIARLWSAYEQKGYMYHLINSHVFFWESDFFTIARTGYSYEFEVKISRSDYWADFNKDEKHRLLGWEHDTYFRRVKITDDHKASEWFQEKMFPDPDARIIKHSGWPKSKFIYQPTHERRPNRFYYAVPEGLLSPDEIPEYAGLVYVLEDWGKARDAVKVIKRAPLLQKQKKDFTQTLLKKYYYKYRSQIQGLERSGFEKHWDSLKEQK